MRKTYAFIVGAPRSGTTWLQIMLSRHPSVDTCQETHLFNYFLSPLHRTWRGLQNNARGIGLKAAISYARFIELKREFALSVLDSIGDGPVILEKTPNHVRMAGEILEVLPEARFLHLIRDPRAVAASLAAAGRTWGEDWASTKAEINAELWRSDITAGRKISALTENVLEIRYEDLLTNRSKTMARITKWLQLPNDPAQSAWLGEDHDIEQFRSGTASAPWDLSREPEGFYRQGKAEGWRDDLSLNDIAIVEAITGLLMDELGYRRTSRGLSWLQRIHLKSSGSLSWRVNALGQRLSRF